MNNIATVSGPTGNEAEKPTYCWHVAGVRIANGGSGYSDNPVIEITGTGAGARGAGARATAQVDEDGIITSITMVNNGGGYTEYTKVTVKEKPEGPTAAKAELYPMMSCPVTDGKSGGCKVPDGNSSRGNRCVCMTETNCGKIFGSTFLPNGCTDRDKPLDGVCMFDDSGTRKCGQYTGEIDVKSAEDHCRCLDNGIWTTDTDCDTIAIGPGGACCEPAYPMDKLALDSQTNQHAAAAIRVNTPNFCVNDLSYCDCIKRGGYFHPGEACGGFNNTFICDNTPHELNPIGTWSKGCGFPGNPGTKTPAGWVECICNFESTWDCKTKTASEPEMIGECKTSSAEKLGENGISNNTFNKWVKMSPGGNDKSCRYVYAKKALVLSDQCSNDNAGFPVKDRTPASMSSYLINDDERLAKLRLEGITDSDGEEYDYAIISVPKWIINSTEWEGVGLPPWGETCVTGKLCAKSQNAPDAWYKVRTDDGTIESMHAKHVTFNNFPTDFDIAGEWVAINGPFVDAEAAVAADNYPSGVDTIPRIGYATKENKIGGGNTGECDCGPDDGGSSCSQLYTCTYDCVSGTFSKPSRIATALADHSADVIGSDIVDASTMLVAEGFENTDLNGDWTITESSTVEGSTVTYMNGKILYELTVDSTTYYMYWNKAWNNWQITDKPGFRNDAVNLEDNKLANHTVAKGFQDSDTIAMNLTIGTCTNSNDPAEGWIEPDSGSVTGSTTTAPAGGCTGEKLKYNSNSKSWSFVRDDVEFVNEKQQYKRVDDDDDDGVTNYLRWSGDPNSRWEIIAEEEGELDDIIDFSTGYDGHEGVCPYPLKMNNGGLIRPASAPTFVSNDGSNIRPGITDLKPNTWVQDLDDPTVYYYECTTKIVDEHGKEQLCNDNINALAAAPGIEPNDEPVCTAGWMLFETIHSCGADFGECTSSYMPIVNLSYVLGSAHCTDNGKPNFDLTGYLSAGWPDGTYSEPEPDADEWEYGKWILVDIPEHDCTDTMSPTDKTGTYIRVDKIEVDTITGELYEDQCDDVDGNGPCTNCCNDSNGAIYAYEELGEDIPDVRDADHTDCAECDKCDG